MTEGSESDHQKRQTAPMQVFTMREVGIGLLILFVGFVITFLLPVVL